MIHKTAIINDGAQIANNVEIGAFCVIGGNVKIGEGTILKSHVVIDGDTTIGKNNIIYPITNLDLSKYFDPLVPLKKIVNMIYIK